MFSSGFLFSCSSAHRAGGPLVPQDEMYRTVSDDAPSWRARVEMAGTGAKAEVPTKVHKASRQEENFMVGLLRNLEIIVIVARESKVVSGWLDL